MILVWKADILHASRWLGRIDQDCIVSLEESIPLKVRCNALRCRNHVTVQASVLIGLMSQDLLELAKTVLECLNDMRFELGEGVLNSQEILPVGVFLDDLFV